MRRVAVLLTAFACAEPSPPSAAAPVESCRPAGPYTFYPTKVPPPEARIAIQAAMSKWNAFADEHHQLVLSVAGHQRIVWMQPPEPTFTGQWLAADGVMFIAPGRADTHQIALHEFGHALGLEHVAVVGAVMCGGGLADCGPGPSELHEADIVECQRVRSCPP